MPTLKFMAVLMLLHHSPSSSVGAAAVGCCATLLLLLLLPVSAIATSSASHDSDLQQLRHSVQQHPDNPVPHIQLALALHELHHQVPDGGRRVPEAERAYRKALSLLKPHKQHASSYIHVQGNLGALLLSAERPSDALSELQEALELGAQLQAEAGKQQQQQSTAETQQLLQDVEQQLAGLQFNLGKALTSVGRLREAEDAYVAAAAAAYGRDFGSYGKALAALHSISATAAAQAMEVCEAATRHFAAQPHLTFLQDVQQPQQAMTDLSAATASATSEAASAAHTAPAAAGATSGGWLVKAHSMDLVWLYFALHKYFHQAKHTTASWHYLELGNRIMAAHTGYDPSKDQRNLASIKAIFKAPFVTSGLQDRTPIFIAGMPRSGSTLLEQMLASHPQVFAAGEDTALAPLTTTINNALASTPAHKHRALLRQHAEQYLAAMRAKVPINWRPATDHQGDSATTAPGSATATTEPDSTTATATFSTAPDSATASAVSVPSRIVDKMLRNLWLVGYIHMLLPDACIVHVVRHPLDVALSCFAQPFGYSASSLAWAWSLDSIATQLQMTWELADHWEQQQPGRVITVFYEELVEQPQVVLKQLLSACGLPWDPNVLHFHKTHRPVQTASMEQVRQPLYKSSVGRWKQYEQQLEPLSQRLAPLIARYDKLVQQRLQASAQHDEKAAGEQPADAGLRVQQSEQARDEL